METKDCYSVILEKKFFLVTLPESETEYWQFLKKIENWCLQGFNPEDILIFQHIALFDPDVKMIKEAFGEIFTYNYNTYLNHSGNKSREDSSGSFINPDNIFINPFFDKNNFYKVIESDQKKKIVICITDDPYIAQETIGAFGYTFPNPIIVDMVRKLIKEKQEKVKIGYGTVIYLDFPESRLYSYQID